MEDSERIAVWLATEAGIAAGDRVAILAANDARWVAAFAAILRLARWSCRSIPGIVRTGADDRGRQRRARALRRRALSRHGARGGRSAGPAAPRVVSLADAELEKRGRAGFPSKTHPTSFLGRRGGHPLHLRHDGGPEGRRAHARQSRGGTRGGRCLSSRRTKTTSSSAFSRCFTRSPRWPTCGCR